MMPTRDLISGISERQSRRELDLAERRAADDVARRAEVGMVEHVEHVDPELQPMRPPAGAFLISDRSVLWNAGPMTTFLPRLPKRSTATNTDGSNHWSTEPTIRIGPVTSGRTVFGTPFRLLLLVTMFTGLPLCDWTTVATCHPRVRACPVNGNA